MNLLLHTPFHAIILVLYLSKFETAFVAGSKSERIGPNIGNLYEPPAKPKVDAKYSNSGLDLIMNAKRQSKKQHIVLFKEWKLDIDNLKLIASKIDSRNSVIYDLNKTFKKDVAQNTGRAKISDGNQLTGEVKYSYDKRTIELYDQKNQLKWKFSPKYYSAHSFLRALLKNDSLFILTYSPISSGSSVFCFNFKSGQLHWTGEVKHLNVSHSKYLNEVMMYMIEDKIVLATEEMAGNILQVLDKKSGKNLFYPRGKILIGE